MFPVIEHFGDIAGIIEGHPEIRVSERPNGTVNVRYMLMTDILWNHPDSDIFRECRGITFDAATGKILARPLHKFFNLNENGLSQMNNLPGFDRVRAITTKMDGSMVFPVSDREGGFRLSTKAGITSVSMQAETWLAGQWKLASDYIMECIRRDVTPIFEWVSPGNRIVIEYPESQMVLLAVRDNVTGEYLDLVGEADHGSVFAIVGRHDGFESVQDVLDKVRPETDSEGVVIEFDNGERVKVKSEWYVDIHRAVGAIASPYRVIQMWLHDNLDDVKPFLYRDGIQYVEQCLDAWDKILASVYEDVVVELNRIRDGGLTRKEFALNNQCPNLVRALVFKFFGEAPEDADIYEAINGSVIDSRRNYDQYIKLGEQRGIEMPIAWKAAGEM